MVNILIARKDFTSSNLGEQGGQPFQEGLVSAGGAGGSCVLPPLEMAEDLK